MADPHDYSNRTRHWAATRAFFGLRLLLLALIVAGAAGCNRAYYRRQADAEAYTLIRNKNDGAFRNLPRIEISVDPRSRMFDPFNPDRPPMPPDDPDSHQLMHWVDNKPNYPHWHQDGDTPYVESPCWMRYLPADERGVLRLDLATAMQLALLHSPDNQEAYEDLYLSALDVTAERFEFDNQWFAGTGPTYRTAGVNAGLPRSQLAVDSELALRRTYITGATLAANLANSIVWNFNGLDSNSTFSIFDFSIVQPLLRGAGRDRVLTRLTLAERQLLANVRQMEWFRRGFYLEISTGDGGVNGPNRIGGLFGGSGLQGFTGVGGGFGGVGGAFAGARGAQAAGEALQVGGFFGLLQTLQNIRNQQSNIAGLRSNVVQFQQTLQENLRTIPEDPTEIVRNRLQMAQARQTLYNQEFALVSAQAEYQSRLDNFKVTLGLPPRLAVEIDDPLLERFNLLDPDLANMQEELSTVSAGVGTVNERILAEITYTQEGDRRVASIGWNDDLQRNLQLLQRMLERIESLRHRLATQQLGSAQADITQLETSVPGRKQTLERLSGKYPRVLDDLQQLEILGQTRLPVNIDPAALDTTRLDQLPVDLRVEYQRLSEQLGSHAVQIQEIEGALGRILATGSGLESPALYAQLERDVLFAVPGLLAQLNSDLLDLSLVQARARADSIDLVPVDLTMRDAVCIASVNRRDWMNARAGLVDTWRAIAFVANDLEGVLNITANGGLNTVGDNPLDFRSSTSDLQLGVEFDAPLTRLLERNNYRQVLIDYQQARRNYYQFVDRVSQGLRGTLRTLDLNELNFETRRLAVLSAIEQIVLNDEIQTLNEERGQAQGVTAARDIVQALSDLQSAQDDFMGVWITYEVNRRFLDFNLGTMQLDEFGLWVDPGPIQGGQPPYDAICAGCELPILAPNDEQALRAADAPPE